MDYTGMSPEAIRALGSISYNQGLMSLLYLGLIFFFVLGVIEIIRRVRKSKQYRQFKSDMFVAARIGQLAEKYKLDLEKEEISFKKWSKKEKRENTKMELDDVIEEDLSDRIAEDKFNLDAKSTKADTTKKDAAGKK